MQRPVLGYIKNKEIVGVRNLSQEDFAEYKKASSELEKYMLSGQLFSITLLNHDDFVETIRSYLEALSTDQDIGKHNLDRFVLNLNRKILNYLCSARTFLDHNETELKRSFGKSEVEFFKTICSEHFDNSFAYRFLYKLRNYAQHCGMPVGNFIIESEKDPTSETGKRVTVSLLFDRDKLLKRFDRWGAPLKKEISEMHPYFDVAPLLEEMMYRLGDIHLSLIRKLFPNIQAEALLIKQMASEVGEEHGRVIIFDFKDRSEGNAQLVFKDLPLQEAYWVLEDIKKVNAQ